MAMVEGEVMDGWMRVITMGRIMVARRLMGGSILVSDK
jgi:hypothetical protein